MVILELSHIGRCDQVTVILQIDVRTLLVSVKYDSLGSPHLSHGDDDPHLPGCWEGHLGQGQDTGFGKVHRDFLSVS
jgi:hypothetical protein